jgi:hypothetical protein
VQLVSDRLWAGAPQVEALLDEMEFAGPEGFEEEEGPSDPENIDVAATVMDHFAHRRQRRPDDSQATERAEEALPQEPPAARTPRATRPSAGAGEEQGQGLPTQVRGMSKEAILQAELIRTRKLVQQEKAKVRSLLEPNFDNRAVSSVDP